MLFGQIGAPCNQTFGVFKIVIATGGPFEPKERFVPDTAEAMAQGGVAIIVVGANAAPRQLAECKILR